MKINPCECGWKFDLVTVSRRDSFRRRNNFPWELIASYYSVYCPICQKETEEYDDKDEAIAAWNAANPIVANNGKEDSGGTN